MQAARALSITTTPFPFHIVTEKTESYKELLSHDVRPPSRAQLYKLAVSLFHTQEYDLLLLYFFFCFSTTSSGVTALQRLFALSV